MAMLKEATIRYTNVYDTREFEIAVGALDNGNVEPRAMITDVVNLDGAPDAFEELRGRNNQCKVMIKPWRSEEHTSELQSLMRTSYAVFCLKKKKNTNTHNTH